jgi:ribonuclease R
LQGNKPETFFYGFPDMITLGESCSANERRADDATRDVVSWLKCEYIMDKIGEVFPGIISAVTSFGFFVELAEIYVEGLVHISNLGQDYFHFDPTSHQLKGERTGSKFRIGDRVMVKVARVSLDDKKIDFDLVVKNSAKEPATGGKLIRKRRKK